MTEPPEQTPEHFIATHESIFKRDRKLIHWLARWRIVFLQPLGIDINDIATYQNAYFITADSVLAYLIERVHKEHAFRWQHFLMQIEKNSLRLGRLKCIPYLSILCTNHYKRALEQGDYTKKSPDDSRPFSEAAVRNAVRIIIKADLPKLTRMLAGEVQPEFLAIPPKVLPDWYEVAVPASQLYAKEFLGKKLAELEKEMEKADVVEYKQIQHLEFLLAETDIDKEI